MKRIGWLMLIFLCSRCNMIGAGTLGTFREWTFSVPEVYFEATVIKFFENNKKYVVPARWEYLDSWDESGYGSLNGKIFYFGNSPEEMYYVTYTEDPYKDANGAVTTTVSVRAVTKGEANRRWNTKDDLGENRTEIERINERFRKEIITKLEAQMQLKGKMM